MSLDLKPTGADIRAYIDEHECSIQEANATLKREWRANQLKRLRERCWLDGIPQETAVLIHDLIELLESDQ